MRYKNPRKPTGDWKNRLHDSHQNETRKLLERLKQVKADIVLQWRLTVFLIISSFWCVETKKVETLAQKMCISLPM